MKKFLSTIICGFVLAGIISAQNSGIPVELKPFVLKGYSMMDFVKEDLNGDKLKDYILVLKTSGEDTMTFDNPDWDAARPLLLITRQTNGKLKKIANSNSLVLCKNCGGIMGDPYQGITTKPGEFTISFYGGSSWRWSENYTFRFDKLKKDWFLEKHFSASFHSGEPETTTVNTTILRNEAGDISLNMFSPDYNRDTSYWLVNSARTYFYDNPDLRSKPGKSYLINKNMVKSIKRFKNFIECSYSNEKEETTYGFILIKDLLNLPPPPFGQKQN